MDSILRRPSDIQASGLTVIGEARGEELKGQIAVVQVIGHRVKDRRWQNTDREVCLQAQQFSCWNDDDPNSIVLLEYAKMILGIKTAPLLPPVISRALTVAESVISGHTVDLVKGSCHYHTKNLLGTPKLPKWARGRTPVVIIGNHAFYNDVP